MKVKMHRFALYSAVNSALPLTLFLSVGVMRPSREAAYKVLFVLGLYHHQKHWIRTDWKRVTHQLTISK